MALDLFTPKAPPLFGLDISSSSVKMLEIVDAGKGGLSRRALRHRAARARRGGRRQHQQPRGGDRRGEARLQAPWHAHQARGDGGADRRGDHQEDHRSAALREEELEIQVETEANQYIPFALEEVNLDFQVIGPSPTSPDEQEVLIAATRKEKVEDRVAVAESAGLKPLVMDVESFAQQTALVARRPGAARSGGKDQNVAMVDVGANVMNVTVLRNDQSVYTREQAFGGNQLTQDIVTPLRHEPGGGRERQALRRPAR